MKIYLYTREQEMFDAWQKEFINIADVEIILGNILNAKVDAIVSPANSFGYMDGGLDLQYLLYFGWDLQTRLQNDIKEKYNGELLVGQAHTVKTGAESIHTVISAPTMRVPMVLPADTINPYLSTKAAVITALSKYNDIYYKETNPDTDEIIAEWRPGSYQAIAIPAMGFGIGKVPAYICARQMKQAILDATLGMEFPKTWRESVKAQEILYSIGE